jgi:hypothetical protein
MSFLFHTNSDIAAGNMTFTSKKQCLKALKEPPNYFFSPDSNGNTTLFLRGIGVDSGYKASKWPINFAPNFLIF